MQLVVIGDNTARAQAFEAKDLDLIQSPLSPQDIKRLQGNSAFMHAITSGLGMTYLNFNTGDPAVADPKIRRALAMLVDQSTIVGDLYQGVDQVATFGPPALFVGLRGGREAAGLRSQRRAEGARGRSAGRTRTATAFSDKGGKKLS